MTGWLQGLLSLSLALGLHLGVMLLPDWSDAAQATAAGSGGEQAISLAAQDGSLADLVADWTRPPLVQPADDRPLENPPAPEPAPQLALPDAPAADLPPLPALADLPPAPDRMPAIAPPPPPPEPEAEAEPEAKPEPAAKPKARPKKAPETPPAPPKPKAAKKEAASPAPEAAPRKKETAKGTGGGAAAGKSGTAAAPKADGAATEKLEQAWGAKIRARIEAKKVIPKAANGASGTVKLRIVVSRGGKLQGVSVARSSGNDALDSAALKAVKSARFPAAPKGLTKDTYSFTLQMKFAS